MTVNFYWKSQIVKSRIEARAWDKAVFGDDDAIYDNYLRNINSVIDNIEQRPRSNPLKSDSIGRTLLCATLTFSPGRGDVLLYDYNPETGIAIGFGVFPYLPDPFPT